MTPRTPSTRRIVWGLVKVGVRRWRNRIFGRLMAAFRKKHRKRTRQATAPKRSALGSLQVVMAAVMVAGSFGMAAGLLMRVGRQSSLSAVPGKTALSKWAYDILKGAEEVRAMRRHELDDGAAASGPASRPRPTTAATGSGTRPGPPPPATAQHLRRQILQKHGFVFESAARRLAGPFGNRTEVERRIRQAYLSRGLDAFHALPRRRRSVLPDRRLWAQPPHQRALTLSIGLILTGLVLMLVFRSFAAANLDLATPRWGLEWFFTFPIPARAIFAARLLQLTVLNAFSWLTVFPLMTLAYVSAGLGAWAVPAAAGVALAVNAAVASIQVIGETWMRRRLSRAQLSNIVGLCTIFQMLFFVGTMAVAAAPQATQWFVSFAQRLPHAVEHLPTFLPLRLCRPQQTAWPLALAGLATIIAMPLLAATVCQRLVRDGLIAHSGTYLGWRGRARAGSPRGRMLGGMLGKELRLLARDRSFLAQTIVLPVVLCLFQVLLNPALFRAAADDVQHATAVAFGAGAYVVLMSGARLLASEVRGLWLLYTLPQRLDRLLLRKIALWAGFGTLFATGVWFLLTARHGGLGAVAILNAAIALSGVGIFGCVSAGLSALGTDATLERPRVAAPIVYLNMLLAGLYVSAVYTPSVWQKAVVVALFGLVACAVWQKVRGRIPYLLDPTETPPPSLALSDALIAVFAFFALHSLLVVLLYHAGLSVGAMLAVSYAAAGLAVVALSLLIFWRRGVPRLAQQLGLVRSAARRARAPWAFAALRGLGWGALAGAAGAGYLLLVGRIEWLRQLREASPTLQFGRDAGALWITLLAVLAAPPLEEYLFRGLLLRGLTRSTRPWLAILASAAAFAVVHPPISFLPVFLLGVTAAVAFRSTGLLIAPIVAHMTYNTTVMAAAVFLS